MLLACDAARANPVDGALSPVDVSSMALFPSTAFWASDEAGASSTASVFPSTVGVGVVSTNVAFAGAFALVAAGTATGTSAVAAPSAENCSLDGTCACGSDPGTGFEWTAGEEAVVEGAAGEAAVRAGSDSREGKSSMCSSTYFTRG